MKTLKKTLCLVLAMVMVFGLCAVSASAKLEFSDNDDITYAEAVDVLSGIGILKGDTRGFRPQDTITRAEAAKIIAYIKIGNATQADALKASADPFTDVPATHWSAGYIAYCASLNIIGGMGDGTYHPNDPVSGLAFAKMLLCALGYGAQNEYTGGDWSVKTASDAIRYGVFDDNMAGASEKAATREECALYAFNVIARVRDGQYGLKKVSWSQLAGDYVADGAFNGGTGSSVDANKKDTFAKDFNLGYKASDPDDFKRPTGHKWTQKVGNATKTITADYPDSDVDVTVFTTKVTGGDMYELFGSDAKKLNAAWDSTNSCADTDATVELYVDGVATQLTLTPNVKFVKGNNDQIPNTGNGVETYVYSSYTGNDNHLVVKICIVNTWLAKVDKVNKASSSMDRNVQLSLLGQNLTAIGVTTSTKYETEEFEKGDYVLITAANNKIQSMEPAEIVEGEITRFNKDGTKLSIVVDGTTYAPAAKVTDNEGNWTDGDSINKGLVGKEYKVYVNKGYVIAVAAVTADSSYVYVAQFGFKTNGGDDLSDKGVFQADIYYADGSHKIVPIDTTHKADCSGYETTTASENFFSATANGAATNPDEAAILNRKPTAESPNAKYAVGIYKLDMYKGKAILTSTATDGSDELVNKGVEYIDGSKTFDSKTVFFYVSGSYDDDLKVTAYTGINNVPVAKGSDTALKKYIAEGTPSVVKVALVEPSFSGAGDTVYFYTGTGSGEFSKVGTTDVIYYVYAAGADVKTEIQQTYKSDDVNDAISDASATGFYKVGNNGKLTGVTGPNGDLIYVGSTTSFTVNGNTLTVGANGYALYDCHIVDVTDSADPITDKTELTGCTIYFAYNKDTKAVTDLYVTAHPV